VAARKFARANDFRDLSALLRCFLWVRSSFGAFSSQRRKLTDCPSPFLAISIACGAISESLSALNVEAWSCAAYRKSVSAPMALSEKQYQRSAALARNCRFLFLSPNQTCSRRLGAPIEKRLTVGIAKMHHHPRAFALAWRPIFSK
jgi:hypothetical protein